MRHPSQQLGCRIWRAHKQKASQIALKQHLVTRLIYDDDRLVLCVFLRDLDLLNESASITGVIGRFAFKERRIRHRVRKMGLQLRN